MVDSEEKKYISDEIGEEYKSWKENDVIFINSQTGSGKSYFILHKLLPYYIKNNLKILYFVNRNILKEQLIEEIHTKVEIEYSDYFAGTIHSINDYINITTYQYIENIMLLENPRDIYNFVSKFDICIYDECHYFYSDSLYNTYTELSFDFLRKLFDNKIQVFISATIDNMIPIIKKRRPIYTRQLDGAVAIRRFTNNTLLCPIRYISYPKNKVNNDYTYINLKIFNDIEDLKSLIINDICNDNRKWLIFIDSINSGKMLCKDLQNRVKEEIFKNKIIFIDAQYKYREEAEEEIKEISKNNKIKKQVIITTPVMDNGISIHDVNLKNIVIMCDTKEEFIQMLGRKRIDKDSLTLFILMRDKIHFEKRKLLIDKIYSFYLKHYKNISKMYNVDFKVSVSIIPSGMETVELSPVYCWMYNVNLYTPYQNDILMDMIYPDYFNEYQKICYTLNGYIAFNSFSISKCKNLMSFYKNIIEKLKEDSYAFVKEQQRWLGIPDDKIDLNVYNFEEEARKKIENSIEHVLDKTLSQEENIDLKLNIFDNIISLLNSKSAELNKDDIEKHIKSLKKDKTGRIISDKEFNSIMEILNLPYKMEKPTGNSYTIIMK